MTPARSSAALWTSPAERVTERKAKSDAILQAAATLFAERGFHRTAMDDVAAALGLTKPTVYHYFKTKNDVLLAILADAIAAIEAAFNSARPDAPALDALAEGLGGYVEVACTPQGAVLVQTLDTDLDPASRRAMVSARSVIDERIRALLERGVQEGAITASDPRLTAFLIAGAINSIARWYRADGRLRPAEISRFYIDQLKAGLRPRLGVG